MIWGRERGLPALDGPHGAGPRRIRIGGYTLEFRAVRSFAEVAPEVSEDGETLLARPEAAGLARPGAAERPSRRPLADHETRRHGHRPRRANAHIALPDDPAVSIAHVQIQVEENGQFRLEDLRSRNGTFLKLNPISPIPPGAVLLAGKVQLRVIDQSGHH